MGKLGKRLVCWPCVCCLLDILAPGQTTHWSDLRLQSFGLWWVSERAFRLPLVQTLTTHRPLFENRGGFFGVWCERGDLLIFYFLITSNYQFKSYSYRCLQGTSPQVLASLIQTLNNSQEFIKRFPPLKNTPLSCFMVDMFARLNTHQTNPSYSNWMAGSEDNTPWVFTIFLWVLLISCELLISKHASIPSQ